MKRLSCLLSLLTALALAIAAARPAAASSHALDGPLESLGSGKIFSDVSCVSLSGFPPSAECVAVGPDNTLVANHYVYPDPTGGWSGWSALKGIVTSPPSCFVNAAAVLCGVRDADHRLAAYFFNGTTWSGPVVVGGTLGGAPSCVALDFLTSFCAARSPGAGALSGEGIFSAVLSRKKLELPVTFSFPAFQPETIYSDVTCTSDSQELADAHCAWIGDGGAAKVRRFSSTSNTWLSAVGTVPYGTPAGTPQCTPFALDKQNDTVFCFAVGRDAHPYYTESHLTANGTPAGPDDFVAWLPLYDANVERFGCAPTLDLGIELNFVCAATGTDDGSLLTVRGSDPREFIVAGEFIGTPFCFPLALTGEYASTIKCVVRSDRNLAYSQTYLDL